MIISWCFGRVPLTLPDDTIISLFDYTNLTQYLIKYNIDEINLIRLFMTAYYENKLNIIKYIIENNIEDLEKQCIKDNYSFNNLFNVLLYTNSNFEIFKYLIKKTKIDANKIFMEQDTYQKCKYLLKNYTININCEVISKLIKIRLFDILIYVIKIKKIRNELNDELKNHCLNELLKLYIKNYYYDKYNTKEIFQIFNYILSNTNNLDILSYFKNECYKYINNEELVYNNKILQFYMSTSLKKKYLEIKIKHAKKKILYFFYKFVAPVIYHPDRKIAQNTINNIIKLNSIKKLNF